MISKEAVNEIIFKVTNNIIEKKIDLSLLSSEEFDALPAETLRRMRGDFG